MELNWTRHSEVQRQRRATPTIFESLVLDRGTHVRSHGADIVFLDKAAKKRIRHEVGGDRGMRIFERWMNSYLVVADNGQIITAARRTRRVKRA